MFLGHSAWLTPWFMAGEIAPRDGMGLEIAPPLIVSDLFFRRGRLFLRKRSRCLELIGSVVVAVPADYTRYS
jgi:hypothetical protein